MVFKPKFRLRDWEAETVSTPAPKGSVTTTVITTTASSTPAGPSGSSTTSASFLVVPKKRRRISPIPSPPCETNHVTIPIPSSITPSASLIPGSSSTTTLYQDGNMSVRLNNGGPCGAEVTIPTNAGSMSGGSVVGRPFSATKKLTISTNTGTMSGGSVVAGPPPAEYSVKMPESFSPLLIKPLSISPSASAITAQTIIKTPKSSPGSPTPPPPILSSLPLTNSAMSQQPSDNILSTAISVVTPTPPQNPKRPTSLALKPVNTNLSKTAPGVLPSPETPRTAKSFNQTTINGHAYTYLGFKVSTRSSYTCLFKTQPMFIPQDAERKLSMYSNWQPRVPRDPNGALEFGISTNDSRVNGRKSPHHVIYASALGKGFDTLTVNSPDNQSPITSPVCEEKKFVTGIPNSTSNDPAAAAAKPIKILVSPVLNSGGGITEERDVTSISPSPSSSSSILLSYPSSTVTSSVVTSAISSASVSGSMTSSLSPPTTTKPTPKGRRKKGTNSDTNSTEKPAGRRRSTNSTGKRCQATEQEDFTTSTLSNDGPLAFNSKSSSLTELRKEHPLSVRMVEGSFQSKEDFVKRGSNAESFEKEIAQSLLDLSKATFQPQLGGNGSVGEIRQPPGAHKRSTYTFEPVGVEDISNSSGGSAGASVEAPMDLSVKPKQISPSFSYEPITKRAKLEHQNHNGTEGGPLALVVKEAEHWEPPGDEHAMMGSTGMGASCVSVTKVLNNRAVIHDEDSSSLGATGDGSGNEYTPPLVAPHNHAGGAGPSSERSRRKLHQPWLSPGVPEKKKVELIEISPVNHVTTTVIVPSTSSAVAKTSPPPPPPPVPQAPPAIEIKPVTITPAQVATEVITTTATDRIKTEGGSSKAVEISIKLVASSPTPLPTQPPPPPPVTCPTSSNSGPIIAGPSAVKPKAEFKQPSGPQALVMDEGKAECNVCGKKFARASQLTLHMNIHYIERPFRCDPCGVSFQTKGHLIKHRRSSSHDCKVYLTEAWGVANEENPRPFKCPDCKIAFRIHGHLAKHLRSKMHIMKMECLGKLPFGIYHEMEKCGINLNEIDTTDCDMSLVALQNVAKRIYGDQWRERLTVPVEEQPN